MKSFFKTLLASTLGVIIGSTILSIISFIVFIGVIASAGSKPKYNLQDQTILSLNLNGMLKDREISNPFLFLSGSKANAPVVLDDILDAIKKAKENDKIKGIYIKAEYFGTGFANLEPIRKALIDFKSSGKFVVAYGDSYHQGTYYLASVADKVIINPQGMLDLSGLGATIQFSKGLYEKLGINFQVFKVGTYKSAVEPYISDKMSDANREQITSYLNDVWGNYLKGVSENRKISIENLNNYADECMAFSSPESYIKYNLVDTLMYEEDVKKYLKELVKIEDDKDLRLATISDLKTVNFKEKNKNKEQIAVIYAEGSIVGELEKGLFAGENTITSKEYVEVFEKVKKDKDIKAVVFRVNSGGGSAYESEQIWKAVMDLKKVKPVIVSMGNYAASGGYYISCAADTIVAEPNTLTGSIGIFGLIPEGEALAKKMGLTYDEVKTNKHSTIGGAGLPFVGIPTKPFNDEEKRMIQAYVERGYDLFLTRCADGRSKTKAEIDSIGQGRVWTGNQAIKLGLVDVLGGLDDAIKIAAAKANITSYGISKYPETKDFFTQLMEESFGEMKQSFIKKMMGEKEYNELRLLQGLQSLDCRMAVSPYGIQE